MKKIAEMTGGLLKGCGELEISSISLPSEGSAGSISPLWEKKHLGAVSESAVLLTKPGWTDEGRSGVEVDEPRLALNILLEYFEEKVQYPETIDETSAVSPKARLGDNVYIGPFCSVGEAEIGADTVIKANVYIEDGVKIGAGTLIEPGAVIFSDVTVGARCIIRAGAVIGCEGFGFVPDKELGIKRIPQIGRVEIGDGAEIGAFSSVDRATFGVTSIGRGTKIDSHVKIGHNCKVGDFCIIVSQSGLAGTTTLGNGVTLGAQSGVANHATIGDGAVIAARAGVSSDVSAKAVLSGFPARDHKEELRERAMSRRLPELMAQVKALAKEIEELKKQ